MEISVRYSDFKDIIKDIRVEFSEEQVITFRPTETKNIINDKEVIEKVVELRYRDDNVNYKESAKITRAQINDLIKVLQELKFQIKE